ncbi:MAG: haloacid dehalogenase [Cyanobacteria bacterium J06634_6]
MAKQIVLTALDDVLLPADDVTGGWEHGLHAQRRADIAKLKAVGIAVIVFTQRDRTELEGVRSRLNLTDPFITESGSAIFTPAKHNLFESPLGEKEGDYFVEVLGCPYVQARAGLRVLANMISHPLKGFGDFTVPQLQKSAKLSEADAHAAKAREFSEPFMTPKAVDADALSKAAEGMGFKVILRAAAESRFSELVGSEAGLENAVQKLVMAYWALVGESDDGCEVVAISNRHQELALIEKACEALDQVHFQPVLSAGAEKPADWLEMIAPYLNLSSENR